MRWPQVRKRKWENYSSGEELFGLPVTAYPELERTEKELSLLDRLYSLYTSVISTINGYADVFWVEVVSRASTKCRNKSSASRCALCRGDTKVSKHPIPYRLK